MNLRKQRYTVMSVLMTVGALCLISVCRINYNESIKREIIAEQHFKNLKNLIK